MKFSAQAVNHTAILAVAFAIALPSFAAAKVPYVGRALMYPSKNIVQNGVNSKAHTTLVAAVKAAGLVDTLQGAGPFTSLRPPTLPSASCRKALSPHS